MQYVARGSFWGDFFRLKMPPHEGVLWLIRLPEPCAKLSSDIGITAPRAQLISLDDEDVIVARQWPTHRLYLAHTIGTQGIESHAVFSSHEVFGELCL